MTPGLVLTLVLTLVPSLTPSLALARVPTAGAGAQAARAEVRGTWLTTTANTAIATPQDTAQTMRRLREIGLNTVYVEAWKNGTTQFPSEVLRRTLGLAQRPAAALQDPADRGKAAAPVRDLLEEMLIEGHRQGLLVIAWFEYGFMAAHGSTHNTLRSRKPEWLSRDRQGREVAPNGFVWMNPLHPQARRFLTDLTLEAMGRYDLDGVQFDDRIVWPHVSMGYDDTTRAAYAAEHQGRAPPDDPQDPAWMQWRAAQLDRLVQEFLRELAQARPGLLLSLSPAVYPWSWEHYLLNWPAWSTWPRGQRWAEWVPQAYRSSWPAFERSWREQTQALQAAGAYHPQELVAGIRLVGEGAPSSWEQLQRSIELVRSLDQGGHVLWFSRGVLDLHAQALQAFYARTDGAAGPAPSPRFAPQWRRPAVPLQRDATEGLWRLPPQHGLPEGRYRAIAHDGQRWRYLDGTVTVDAALAAAQRVKAEPGDQAVELLVDRRADLRQDPLAPPLR
ncbi:MAG: family 10 glycosylhydrolase [Rubrivivax sp.]|nr:family 10 glycosylhydrolase [Rubrivivax sp.]